MKPTLIEEMAAGNAPPFVPLTVDQYHELTRAGVLPEGSPVELLDGLLVYKDRRDGPGMPLERHGPRHAGVVNVLHHVVRRIEKPLEHHARCQQPITLPPFNEPEPDVSLVKGAIRDYARSHPGAGDVAVAFEVAGASAATDRVTKRRIYATAGIPTYVIVDILQDEVVVHTNPVADDGRYETWFTRRRGKSVSVTVGGDVVTFPVDDVLP